MSIVPEDLRYSASHEWVRVEGGEAVVGITDHAQSELGDIVYVEFPDVGRALKQDEVFGTVESVKAVSDLISPVSGEVIGINDAIADATEKVNQAPYTEGWLIRVKLTNPIELDSLLDAAAYEAAAEESAH